MADQEDDSAASAAAKAAVNAASNMVGGAVRGAQRAANAVFGLAPAPGEDNDAYAKAYGKSNSGD